MSPAVPPNVSPASHYVPVLVPERLLPAVYRVLADADTENSTSPPELRTGPPAEPPGAEGAVSGAADERFRDAAFVRAHLGGRSETVRGIATHLAQRPGQWTKSEPIAEALDLEHGWNSLAGALGAAGHYFKNRGIGMPWNWTYETPDRHVELMMDADTAEVILSVL